MHVAEHLINKLVSPAQHGFLSRRSRTTNLLESLNDWTLIVDLGIQTAVIYTEILPKLLILSHTWSFLQN